MPHADMAEGIDDAFVGDNAVGEREFGAGFGKSYWALTFPLVQGWFDVPHYRTTTLL